MSIRLNISVLQKLRAAVEEPSVQKAQVGFFAEKAARTDGLTNPQIAAWHEYGNESTNLPERSILRIPLMIFLGSAIAKLGPGYWVKALVQQGKPGVLARLAVTAENVVQRAFSSKGYGMWAPLKPRTIKRKGSSAILIDSAELRQSLSSRVV